MVSNWTWASAALMSTGGVAVVVQEPLQVGDAVGHGDGGGGTKTALPGRVPPIQFWLRRNSPGSLSLPRPRASSSAWISRIRRTQSGKAAAQARQAVVERRDVARDLDDVVEGHAGRLVDLEEQEVGERRLRPLDLGGEHRLLAHVGVEEEVGVRQQGGDAVESAEGEQAPLQERLESARQARARVGRQGRGTKARPARRRRP